MSTARGRAATSPGTRTAEWRGIVLGLLSISGGMLALDLSPESMQSGDWLFVAPLLLIGIVACAGALAPPRWPRGLLLGLAAVAVLPPSLILMPFGLPLLIGGILGLWGAVRAFRV